MQEVLLVGCAALGACSAAVETADAEPPAARPSAATEPSGYWMGDTEAPVPATLQGGQVIHVQSLRALLAQGRTVVLDVSEAPRRPAGLAPGAPWLPLPHRALPGALWIPGAGAGALTAQFDAFLRGRVALAADSFAAPLDAPIVVYCHDRCWLSWNGAKRVINYGYHHVYWFPDGIEGWQAAGQPTVPAEPEEPAAQSAHSEPPAAAPDVTVPRPSILVLDIELTGDLGGPEFTAEHAQRLLAESARLRMDLERAGMYRIVDASPAQAALDRLRSEQSYLHDCNGCDLDVGRQLHADLVMVPWVDRVSGLILTLTYEIHDVSTGAIAARKSFDFRGDNDNAWNHAIDFMVKDLQAASHTPADRKADGPTDGPADRLTDRPAERPTDRPAERPTDRPAERPADRPAERPADR